MEVTCLVHLLHTVEATRPRFEPGNKLAWDVNCFIENSYTFFFTVCVGKSTFDLLTPLIPALGSQLSNRCCRCAGIVLQNGYQVANRVTGVCGKSAIHVITSELSRQQAGRVCALVNIKWFDFNKKRLLAVTSIWRIVPVFSIPPPLTDIPSD